MSKQYFTSEQVAELERFFSQYKPTSEVISFGLHVKIVDQELFIRSGLRAIKNNSGKRVAFPTFNRLRVLKRYLESK